MQSQQGGKVKTIPSQSDFLPVCLSYLSVEEDVDDGVVKGGALGEERRRGHEDRSELRALIGKYVPCNAGIWQPAHQERDHHNDHNPSDLFLCPLSALRLLLLSCGLAKQHREGGSKTGRRKKRKANLIIEVLICVLEINM